METKTKNRILGIVATEFNTINFYDFVVDSYVLGKENFDFVEFRNYFNSKVLKSKRYDGTTYNLYSPMMESAMLDVFLHNILPVARETFAKAYEILKAEDNMYHPFQHISSYQDWHGFMSETLMEHLEDDMNDWGYEDEDDCDCGCPDCIQQKN
jgi:hypothetical protein